MELLIRWLASANESAIATTGTPITRVRTFRVSSKKIFLLIQNLVAGLGQAEHDDPDVKIAKQICPMIVESTREGMEARRRYGVFEARKSHVEGANGRALLGFLVPIGNTLFVLLKGSAHKADVSADVPEDQRNSLIQLQRSVIRTLSDLGRQHDPNLRLEVHFTEESRMARSVDHAADLLRTLRRHKVRLFTRGTEWDTRDSKDTMLLNMLMGQAASDRDASVYRMTKGKLAALIAGRLPENLGWHVPFTHGPHVESRTHARSGEQFDFVDPTLIDLIPGKVTFLADLIREILRQGDVAEREGRRHLPWDDIAVWASRELGLKSRVRQDLSAPLVDIEHLENPGQALKRHLDERMIGAWRTGLLSWTTWTDTRIPGLTEQLEVLEENDDGRVRVAARVSCPIPEGGWGISDDEWDRLEALLNPTNPTAGRPASGWGCPLVSDPWFSPEGSVQRRVTANKENYLLLERPASSAFSETGMPSGWRKKNDVQIVGSLNGPEIHAALGSSLEQLLCDLETDVGVLEVRIDTAETSDRERALQQSRKTLSDEVSHLATRAEGARVAAQWAAADGDRARHDDHVTDESELRSKILTLEAEIAELDEKLSSPPPASEGRETVDVSQLALVAAALQQVWVDDTTKLHNAATLPPEVATAARAVFRRSFRAEVIGRYGTSMRWEVTCHLPLADGRTAERTMTGVIKNARTETSAHGHPRRLAELYLHDGCTHDYIGDQFHIDGSGKTQSLLVQTLKRYLEDPGEHDRSIPSSDARRVILDAPHAVRRVIWAWKEDELSQLDDLPSAWVDHVIDTYSSPDFTWGEAWAADTWKTERHVIDLILGQESPRNGASLEEVLDQVSVSRNQVVRFSYSRPFKRFATAPKRDHPAILDRNWDRCDTPAEGRRLFLLECPHDDCPQRPSKERPLLDHVLYVPENPTGMLCRSCRRPPDPTYKDLPFPDAYLEPWRKTTKQVDGIRSRSTTDPLPASKRHKPKTRGAAA